MKRPPLRRTLPACFAVALLPPLASLGHAQHPSGHDTRALDVDPSRAGSQIAPVLEGLGDHHHPVTTGSERAQMFFDQGLKLTYGFNHQEALRSFKEAARLDPSCAMAYWGWALVLGPNLNLPMAPEVATQAYEAIQQAMAKRHGVSPRERRYIEALAERYVATPPESRAALDAAYAEAMGRLHRSDRGDTDAATLYAAALMNLSPWSYWTRDGRPRERTEEIRTVLEGVLENDPEHEGALHYTIHLLEAVDPDAAVGAADALRGLTPGAGHLVHMPSHIDMLVGRYAESFEANRLAAEADEGYLAQCRAQGIYPLAYYPHNVHFLAWAAIMQGRAEEALAASRKVASGVPRDLDGDYWGLHQSFLSMPLYTLARFGRWAEVLAEPPPTGATPYWTGIWHYARGLAFAHTGKPRLARREHRVLAEIAGDPDTARLQIGFSNAVQLLGIAALVLEAEIAAQASRHERAIQLLDRAVRLQDGLAYNEPPDWYYPVRHTLGAVLLAAGKPDEAEVVYWQDLRENRENGFALFGLWQSLEAQGRPDEAAEIQRRYAEAWREADRELSSSRY